MTVFVELRVVASFLTPTILFALVCLLTAKKKEDTGPGGTSPPTRVLSRFFVSDSWSAVLCGAVEGSLVASRPLNLGSYLLSSMFFVLFSRFLIVVNLAAGCVLQC